MAMKPYKKQSFSDRDIYSLYQKYPDKADRSPEITQEIKDKLKQQFPNYMSAGMENGIYTLYATKTEYQISHPFPNFFIVTVYERSNYKDTSKPKDKYFLIEGE
jgi:hypothetical protein